MIRTNNLILYIFFFGSMLIFSSCEKDVVENVVSNDAIQESDGIHRKRIHRD